MLLYIEQINGDVDRPTNRQGEYRAICLFQKLENRKKAEICNNLSLVLVRRCASAGRVLMMSAGNSGKTATLGENAFHVNCLLFFLNLPESRLSGSSGTECEDEM